MTCGTQYIQVGFPLKMDPLLTLILSHLSTCERFCDINVPTRRSLRVTCYKNMSSPLRHFKKKEGHEQSHSSYVKVVIKNQSKCQIMTVPYKILFLSVHPLHLPQHNQSVVVRQFLEGYHICGRVSHPSSDILPVL